MSKTVIFTILQSGEYFTEVDQFGWALWVKSKEVPGIHYIIASVIKEARRVYAHFDFVRWERRTNE